MFTRFGQIFWGLLLVILDLRFNSFDVLPDFIGYILVAVGCGGLVVLSRRFSTAQTLSWILAVVCLVGFFIPNDFAALYHFVHIAVDCGMIWFLLGGVMEFASARERPDLSLRASNRRVAYVALMCAATVIGFVARGSRDVATVMGVIFIICIIPLLVLILHLIHRVKHELVAD
jgi:predicted MFS family arabinose efflux permease